MNRTTLQVDGMTCASCRHHVDSALHELEGVDAVEVRIREGIVVVHHDPAVAPPAALIEALREAGYESRQAA